ncbi:MAG: EAL domain-containing protein [Lachnospiraceae bacterium]
MADMPSLKTILVVDDNTINRTILSKILSDQYTVIEAENGQIALKYLSKHNDEIVAIMLDLVMPVMDGYTVLETIRNNDSYSNLPIVVTTENSNCVNERKALSLGAWDFVTKPYDAEIIMFRLNNVIYRSQFTALKQLKYLTDYDALTGLYNKTKFFETTRAMLDTNREESFVFLRFDVDRFQLINSFFGTAEGDKLLIYIANQMATDAKKYIKATYGRIESDIIALCVPYHTDEIEAMVCQSKKTLTEFNPNYDIVPSIGIYVIDDLNVSVEEMYNRATLAAKTCKGNYIDFYAYYNESMSAALTAEQMITNDMKFALENGQFEVYLQPKYNIHTNLPCGAEALVRWKHPKQGMLPPSEFIPIFERNGFITKLDYYVWEQVCKHLNRWISQGIEPYPISVNVSRVNIYNPNLLDTMLELLERYELQPALLNLELTESAYTDNPISMKKMITKLQNHGFTILMDDFGSGYSSLALLKDIALDVLKIDMLFLSKTEIPGRGENIIASVIRMAKWLNIPVIAEGAETSEQVDFLRSVGCDYVQGYYFARPMPTTEYEQLYSSLGYTAQAASNLDAYHYDDLFSDTPEMKLLFSSTLQVAVIYEFADEQIEMIRVNEAYYALLGHDDMRTNAPNVLELIEPEYRESLLQAFRSCIGRRETVECEYIRNRISGTPVWIHTKLRYVAMVGGKYIIIGELTDITTRKELNKEFQKHRENWRLGDYDTHTILIVDDAQVNRMVLKKILQDDFLFLEAENGAEAIEILMNNANRVDLILLDISMPIMDGKEFLKQKKIRPELDSIPVIMITADDSPQQQTSTFSLGANDYIVKPFIPAVVTHRVSNVLESNYRFKEMVREYNTLSVKIKTDLMTGLINRVSAEKMISRRLENKKGTCVMIILDIDNFKQINDVCGHDYGDKVINAVANQLCLYFRKEDIIARIGGDEFAVFIENIKEIASIEKKARQLCESMANVIHDDRNVKITCSVGIAVSSETDYSFESLYHQADKAVYSAKCHGKNNISIYNEEIADYLKVADVIETKNENLHRSEVNGDENK